MYISEFDLETRLNTTKFVFECVVVGLIHPLLHPSWQNFDLAKYNEISFDLCRVSQEQSAEMLKSLYPPCFQFKVNTGKTRIKLIFAKLIAKAPSF